MAEDSHEYLEAARARKAVRGPFGNATEWHDPRTIRRAQAEAARVLAELDARRRRARRGAGA